MTRLTPLELIRVKQLNEQPELTEPELLELIAYCNWDKFGQEKVNKTWPNVNNVGELIDALIFNSINQINFQDIMNHLMQARHWFSIFECERDYENQFTTIIDEKGYIEGTDPVEEILPGTDKGNLEQPGG